MDTNSNRWNCILRILKAASTSETFYPCPVHCILFDIQTTLRSHGRLQLSAAVPWCFIRRWDTMSLASRWVWCARDACQSPVRRRSPAGGLCASLYHYLRYWCVFSKFLGNGTDWSIDHLLTIADSPVYRSFRGCVSRHSPSICTYSRTIFLRRFAKSNYQKHFIFAHPSDSLRPLGFTWLFGFLYVPAFGVATMIYRDTLNTLASFWQ